jgi:molecular chaperone GrpE (heat shock protein)
MQFLEESAGLSPIARQGASYDPIHSTVAGVHESSDIEEGHVHAIVRQGWRRDDGSVVRQAVVVVGKYCLTPPTETAPQ